MPVERNRRIMERARTESTMIGRAYRLAKNTTLSLDGVSSSPVRSGPNLGHGPSQGSSFGRREPRRYQHENAAQRDDPARIDTAASHASNRLGRRVYPGDDLTRDHLSPAGSGEPSIWLLWDTASSSASRLDLKPRLAS